MRHEKFPLDFKASVAAGDPQLCENLVDKYVQLGGAFTATIAIEGRLDDNMPWFAIATVSAVGMTSIPQPVKHIRLNTTAYTSSTSPVAVLAGRQARTE